MKQGRVYVPINPDVCDEFDPTNVPILSKQSHSGLFHLTNKPFITIIASWAINHGIGDTYKKASGLSLPARLFLIYYPFGNMATGYVVILSLLAGVVGFTTSATGINNVAQWKASNLYAASASALISWPVTHTACHGL
ncbi:AWPM-19-like family protein [Artemisia annua]|uniref:AWPM-19-like family protein n=1 Tax=Artemisia annua TaxID=35608 RepID=A0A2U1LG87_ARTAN|nr:AWPM-19-like family protein [Artemisia annua]